MSAQANAQRVLAVLVLYRKTPPEAAAWDFLCDALEAQHGTNQQGAGQQEVGQWAALDLVHCLVYDNSPQSLVQPALPPGVSYHGNPANGGTAAAYTAALSMVKAQGCGWLLLLDQDTLPPREYLMRAAAALAEPKSAGAAALVPRIVHGDRAISPAVISRFGSVRPVTRAGAGIHTAISSGLLIQADALARHLPKDPVFWLDYLDHMIFLSMSRGGAQLTEMDVEIAHDLSVQDPATLSPIRLASILTAERAFCNALGPLARAMLPPRRLLRAARYLVHKPMLSMMLLRSAFD